jgi:8-oxo-dGTP pyrophosphatase MutT (NUDIX family)
MPVEKSCGAVIFLKEEKEVKYLLLHYEYKGDFWDFVKGNAEEGESEKETIIREAREEAGVKDLRFVEGFRKKISYFYRKEGKLVSKQVVFLLAETKTKDIKLSYEHAGYEWLGYEKALERVTFKNSKNILSKAQAFLKEKGKQKTLV